MNFTEITDNVSKTVSEKITSMFCDLLNKVIENNEENFSNLVTKKISDYLNSNETNNKIDIEFAKFIDNFNNRLENSILKIDNNKFINILIDNFLKNYINSEDIEKIMKIIKNSKLSTNKQDNNSEDITEVIPKEEPELNEDSNPDTGVESGPIEESPVVINEESSNKNMVGNDTDTDKNNTTLNGGSLKKRLSKKIPKSRKKISSLKYRKKKNKKTLKYKYKILD